MESKVKVVKPVRSFITDNDVEALVRKLGAMFREKTSHLSRYNNAVGTKLHTLQVDFCYLVNEFERGYKFERSINYGRAVAFINEIVA